MVLHACGFFLFKKNIPTVPFSGCACYFQRDLFPHVGRNREGFEAPDFQDLLRSRVFHAVLFITDRKLQFFPGKYQE